MGDEAPAPGRLRTGWGGVTRIASRETEAEWLEFAEKATLKRLRLEVSDAKGKDEYTVLLTALRKKSAELSQVLGSPTAEEARVLEDATLGLVSLATGSPMPAPCAAGLRRSPRKRREGDLPGAFEQLLRRYNSLGFFESLASPAGTEGLRRASNLT